MQAMRVRFALPALAACFLAIAPQPSWAFADLFGTIDGQGNDPLVDAYPFFVFASDNQTAQVLFISDAYRGRVSLSLKCCKDMAGNPVSAPVGVTFSIEKNIGPAPPTPRPNSSRFRIQPSVYAARWGSDAPTPAPPDPPDLGTNEFMTGGHHARWLGLKVVTDGSPQFGRYVAELDATASDNTTISTNVIVNVLPTLRDTPMASCAAFTTTMGPSSVAFGLGGGSLSSLPLAPVSQPFFDTKRKAPNKTTWSIASSIGTSTPMDAGFEFDLSKTNLPLKPDQAMFFFTNNAGSDWEVVAFNAPLCIPVATITVTRGGGSTSLLVDSGTTTTLLLRRDDGKSGFENLAVFNEGPFWTVFGGKEVDATLMGR